MCPNSAVSKGLSTHGDIFPLPPPAGPKHANLLSPAFSNCSPEELRQVRVAANSLNRLVAPCGLEFDNARLPCERRASNLQRKVLSGMLSRIRLTSWRLSATRPSRLSLISLRRRGYIASNRRIWLHSTWANCESRREMSCRSASADFSAVTMRLWSSGTKPSSSVPLQRWLSSSTHSI